MDSQSGIGFVLRERKVGKRRRRKGKYKLDYDAGKERFFTISANCETFGSKGGLFDEID